MGGKGKLYCRRHRKAEMRVFEKNKLGLADLAPIPLLAALCATVLLSACATSPTGRSQLMLISPEVAIAESQRAYFSAMQQFRAQGKLLHDPALADEVAMVAGRVVAAAIRRYPHTRNWHWSVALIDEPDKANAWCMAGGRMALYSGLVRQLDLTDDELAQIMGHEIAHALANHSAEGMSMVMARGAALNVLAASVKSDRALKGASRAALLAIDLPNSREAEAEADRIGIELAARAGYEPLAAATFWAKMERRGELRPPQFLATHPSPASRRDALLALAPKMRQLIPARLPNPHPVEILP